MGFFSDVGDAVKRAVSNPAKLVADISTFGTTAVLRALPTAIGGGQSGIFSKGSEVFGGTAIGLATGFATGGPAGAIVGTASGFGRSVAGVLHNDSGSAIAGGSAKYAAITGSIAGAAKGVLLARAGTQATAFTGSTASGLVGKGANVLYADLASKALTPAATTGAAATSSSGFGALSSLAPLALLKVLQGNTLLPGTSAGSTGVTLNSPGPGAPTSTPSYGPNLYPGVPSGLQTVGPGINGGGYGGGGGVATAPAAAAGTNWLLYAAIALAAFLILQKKKHHG